MISDLAGAETAFEDGKVAAGDTTEIELDITSAQILYDRATDGTVKNTH